MDISFTKENSKEDYWKKESITNWIVDHDKSRWFNILYISLAIILSIWLGLFWLVAVVAAHGIIELYRQYILSSDMFFSIVESIWEIKLDIALIVFAFWLAVYLDFIFGVAGLASGARVAAQTGSRVIVWQRIIRGFFLSLDDVGLAIRAFMGKKIKGKRSIDEEITDDKIVSLDAGSSWKSHYSKADWCSISFGVAAFLLILAAPFLIDKSFQEVWMIVSEEMKPFGE